MTKKELRDSIKAVAKELYKSIDTKVDLDTSFTGISLDIERYPLLAKFPSLRVTIEKLLTSQYDLFIQDVLWVAPRPTTFKIIFNNGQFFYLIVHFNGFIAKIEGKKYPLNTINSLDRASDALSRILSYGSTAAPTEEAPAEEAPAEEVPTEETPAEETPTEETPAEETPEETT
jgi:hypothetical protein